MSDCPEQEEDACVAACDERGTAEGQMRALSLTTCFYEEACSDATCFEDECSAQFDACIGSSSPEVGGSPLAGAAPPGSVPSDLVGTWVGAWDGQTQKLTLNADGSGSLESSTTWQQSACLSFSTTTRSGNIVVDASFITIYATSVIKSVRRCAPPTVDTNQPAVTERLRWHRDENPAEVNTIFIIDGECAAKYPGTEGCEGFTCPLNLYCTIRVLRQ